MSPVRRIPLLRAGRPESLRPSRLLTATMMLALLSGCALRERGPDGDPFRHDDNAPVRLEVRNDHFNDARIYAIWNGDRRRIGEVVGRTSQMLEVEWRNNALRVEVDLIGAGGFVTDPVTVWPGETVVVRVPSG